MAQATQATRLGHGARTRAVTAVAKTSQIKVSWLMAYRSCRQRDLGTSGRVASAAAAPAGLGRGGFRGVGEGFRVQALGVGGGGKRGLLARKAERAPHPMGCGLSPRCPVTGSFHSRLAAPEMGSDLPLQAVRQSFHSGKDSLRQRVCTLCP